MRDPLPPAAFATTEAATSLQRRLLPWAVALLALVALGGWLLTGAAGRYGREQDESALRAVATTAAASIDADAVAALQASPADIGTPLFDRIRAQLKRVHAANPDSRFVYLLRNSDGRIVFLADAEPPTSADYSAPGDVYDDAPPEAHAVFAQGAAKVAQPYRDQWGEWVTGLAPVADPVTGQPIAVLGIDINANQWRNRVTRHRASAATIAVLAGGIALLSVLGLYWQTRFNARLAQLNRDLGLELAERKRADEGLRLAAAVFESTAEGILVTRPDGTIDSVNPAFERITGYSAAEAAGRNPRFLKSGEHDAEFFRQMWTALRDTGKWRGEIWNRRKSGEVYPQETAINALTDGQGRVIHYVAVLSDVTPQKQLESQLRELSVIDGLTGIANRRLFDDTLRREWAVAGREGKPLSLILADIDYFKNYNDRYGHLAGDRCLQQIAASLKDAVRRSGDLVARYGGEEFVVVLPNTDEARAWAIAERLREHVEELQIRNEDSDVSAFVTISLGHATEVPHLDGAPADLVARADRALYIAKSHGRNQISAAPAAA